jgi:murein DD-endopeptidase MepM/ murein hydrolase activator NlpD
MRFDTPKAIFVTSLVLLLTVLGVLFGDMAPPQQTAMLPADSPPAEERAEKAPAEKKEAAPKTDQYGFAKNALNVRSGTLRKDETLADVLTRHDVPHRTVVRVAREARPDFSPRQMRPGHTYRLYQRNDSSKALAYFLYHRDPINYVLLDLTGDSTRVLEKARRVDVRKHRLDVRIEGSLYESITEAGGKPSLASKLADMYAWQIDFFRIRPGDHVRLVYEKYYLDGKPVRLGNILAARFKHLGNDFYGFHFVQNGDADYFDENAESLRKAFLKAPLDYERISSGYTKRRFHPIQKRWKEHLGTDYAADKGTPIRSVGDGIITEAEHGRYNGNYVKIRHNTTYSTQYLHMSKIAEKIEPGERVHQGDVIGYVGETGLATGPHLCYRFWQDGKQVDPYDVEIPPAEPVDSTYLPEYRQTVKEFMPYLKRSSPPPS